MIKHMTAAALAVALTGCADHVVPVTGLTPPAASLVAQCKPLPDVPARDGDPRVRASYYATTRQQYGDCADRHRGLTAWAVAAAK